MVTAPPTKGYAAVRHGEIDVLTVSRTVRAAKVNWLVVHRGCQIYITTTDEEIEKMWSNWAGMVLVREVIIGLVVPEPSGKNLYKVHREGYPPPPPPPDLGNPKPSNE